MKILIVGASGNLGSHLTKYLLGGPHRLRLLTHHRGLPFALPENAKAEIVQADLANPATLQPVCQNIDFIVYVAGVLFRPRPETFLRQTNTVYVQNIVDAALDKGVQKFLLVSFPHIDENTTPVAPATGTLDARPRSVHARTRLDAEKYVFHACQDKRMQPIVLRAGVIYGKDVKLIEAARWLMSKRLLAVWRSPTWIHLLALHGFSESGRDCHRETRSFQHLQSLRRPAASPAEFLGPVGSTLGLSQALAASQGSFLRCGGALRIACSALQYPAPLTRDIVRMGMTSVVADTSRMKDALLPRLDYPTLSDGLKLL